jgi:endothelin-converting enzyme
VASAVQEPLTPFTKILLILLLILLLLSSVFIGLFAGAQHRLSSGKGRWSNTTETVTATVTVPVTTTAVSSVVSATTAFSTSTARSTTTVVIPAPVPTSAPEEVCDYILYLPVEDANKFPIESLLFTTMC